MRALFIFGLLACVAAAQQKADFPLESVRVEGNEKIPAERIVAASGLKIGAPITRPEFNEARDRLLETGAFESVGFNYKPSAKETGFDLTFLVVETEPLYRYRFEELPAKDADIRAALARQEPIFTDAIPPTPQVMNRYSSAIATFLGGGAKVIGEVNSDVPGELMIVFRPMGERRNISEVNFTGNTVFTAQELWKIVNASAIGVPFSEPLFHRILDSSVRLAYEEKGRIRVAFPKIETARSTENAGLVVTVTIDEGEVYKLGEVTYSGIPSSERAELNKLGAWAADQPANFAEIANGLNRIKKSFREEGYLHVETAVERVIRDEARAVDLKIAITPGEQYKMGRLTIKGLDVISEPVIRKLWKMPEGAIYKDSYPDAFLAMIVAEDYFDNLDRTGAEADLRESTRTVDVTLTFVGAKPTPEANRNRR